MSRRTAIVTLLLLSAGCLAIGTLPAILAALFLLDAAILVFALGPRAPRPGTREDAWQRHHRR